MVKMRRLFLVQPGKIAGQGVVYGTCQAEVPVEPGVPEAAPVALHSNLHGFIVIASVRDQ